MAHSMKKAVLMVILETTYQVARQLAVEKEGGGMLAILPEYEVRRAFASSNLIKQLAELDGIAVDDEKQALERLEEEGFTEILVQPFQISAVAEYEKVRDAVQHFAEKNTFSRISVAPCMTVWAKYSADIVN